MLLHARSLSPVASETLRMSSAFECSDNKLTRQGNSFVLLTRILDPLLSSHNVQERAKATGRRYSMLLKIDLESRSGDSTLLSIR